MLRFIHAGDLHFDRSFEGLSNLVAEAGQLLPQLNQKMLDNLVAAACKRQVDFVLLAGDTFHQSRPSLKAQNQLMAAFRQLAKAQIPVYLIFGNHDYYQAERYWFDFPENVSLFTSEQVRSFVGHNQSGEDYEITGFSYEEGFVRKNMLKEFPKRSQATYHIGLYHGELQGENYAPFSLSEMKAKGYDYWALGHIHVPTTLSEQPPILYPGTPQGHNRKETEAGFVTYVELSPGRCKTEPILVASWLWQKKVADVSSCQSPKELLAFVEEYLSEAQTHATFIELNLANVSGDIQSSGLKNGEFQTYLNQVLWQKTPPRQIAALKFLNAPLATDKIALPKKQVAQILQVYQGQPVFDDLLQEIVDHPVAGSLVRDDQDYQAAVLKQAADILATDFLLEEEE